MSSSTVVSLSSFNLLFFTQVLTVLTSTVKYNEYVTDKGKNISIPCFADGNIMWIKENGSSSTIIQTGKFLVFTNISAADRGIYICFASVPIHDTKEVALVVPSTETPRQPSNEINPSDSSAATIVTTTSLSPTNKSTASTTSWLPITPSPESRTNDSSTPTYRVEEHEFQAFAKVNLTVRTPPGPVTQLYFKASTILGFLIWRFNKTNSGGYPLRSFTAEFRNVSYNETPYNSSFEHEWSRMDPINIAPNVRQMEVYRLAPNTTYEFRIWANNHLGSGEVVTTNVTTLPETKEEDLIRLIQPDLDKFDPRVWIIAVSVVLGTLVILAIGLCIVLSKECYQSSRTEFEDGWDAIELIPNIILNPGFCPNDGQPGPFTRTVIFADDDETESYTSEESDHEPRMEKFKRKVSVFFTGPTIKRM